LELCLDNRCQSLPVSLTIMHNCQIFYFQDIIKVGGRKLPWSASVKTRRLKTFEPVVVSAGLVAEGDIMGYQLFINWNCSLSCPEKMCPAMATTVGSATNKLATEAPPSAYHHHPGRLTRMKNPGIFQHR